ncbi:MAG: hypothetical protein JEY99_19070 [Spirochaetales bacterium]|nr:hypothetical protein [Spirochaetales bacterium]
MSSFLYVVLSSYENNKNQKITIKVWKTYSRKKKGDTVMISVKDNGHGIKKSDFSKINDPLFTTKPQNLGLGLTVANSIIHKHAGEMEVTSIEEEGTTVTIKLFI